MELFHHQTDKDKKQNAMEVKHHNSSAIQQYINIKKVLQEGITIG